MHCAVSLLRDRDDKLHHSIGQDEDRVVEAREMERRQHEAEVAAMEAELAAYGSEEDSWMLNELRDASPARLRIYIFAQGIYEAHELADHIAASKLEFI